MCSIRKQMDCLHIFKTFLKNICQRLDGIIGSTILGPFFIERALTGEKYYKLRQHDMIRAFATTYNAQILNII